MVRALLSLALAVGAARASYGGMDIVTDECFEENHAECSGKLGDGYGDACCGCECHREAAAVTAAPNCRSPFPSVGRLPQLAEKIAS